MTRIARVVLPNVPLHITQRGIRRFDVFGDDADRQTYLKVLRESCRRSHLRICAFCLMTNHVHIVAIPARTDSLSKAFHRCHGIYATHFNRKYGAAGHLWQARPYSCALDEEHFWAAMRYVELNPVRAGMVERAEDYPWSSAAAHCGLRHDDLLDPEWKSPVMVANWRLWLESENGRDIDERIRDRTFNGRPCGDETFVHDAEQLLQRQLRPKKPGPKPKLADAQIEPELWRGHESRS